MKLSLLICHLPERGDELNRLYNSLYSQTIGCPLAPNQVPDVEVLVDARPREITTGEKRNALIEKAQGDFTAFIDDDDVIAPRYLERILGTISQDPTIDCIGLEGIITVGGLRRLNPKKFIHSVRYDRWFEDDKNYYRPCNHLNPIARRHALATKFPHKTIGEDHEWSMAIRPLLKKEIYLEGPIYYYLCK